jgi:hypothetical protein
MTEFYNGLSIRKKIEFTTGPSAKCTRDPSLRKFFFYRFAYDFWFHMFQRAKGLNHELYQNITNIPITKDYGAWANEERERILHGLGIQFSLDPTKTDVFIKRNSINPKALLMSVSKAQKEYGEFKLDNTLISIYEKSIQSVGHAIAGIVTPEGEYMIVDSNNKSFKHDWANDLRGVLKYYPGYYFIYYTSIMYIKPKNLPEFNKNVFRHEKETNSKGREILTGRKGGKYIMVSGRKVYITVNKEKEKSPVKEKEKSPVKEKEKSPVKETNSKGRTIHTGHKGGKYVLIGNRKVYIKPTTKVVVVHSPKTNSKGRTIYTGTKGGKYVLEGNRKIYIKKT